MSRPAVLDVVTTLSPPIDLRVDHEACPGAVPTDRRPVFSWRREGDGCQQAYRIRVSRSPQTLAAGTGDAWDSGRVQSNTSTEITYDGVPLESDETYCWQVRVWDESGSSTQWSDVRQFSTALDPTDWDGDWIAYQPDPGDSNGYRSRWRPASFDGSEYVQVDLGESRSIAAVELHPASPFDGPVTPDGTTITALFSEAMGDEHPITARGADGFGFPARYRIEISDDPEFRESTIVVDRTEERQPNPGRDVRSHDVNATGRYVRVTATGLYEVGPTPGGSNYHSTKVDMTREERRSWRVFALAALAVRDADGDDVAVGCDVSASSSAEEGFWSRDRLVDGAYDSSTVSSSPLLRTDIDLAKPVERARIHVAALGWGDVYVNGDRVSDGSLNPAWTRYDERALYTTHDVTDALREGDNALGIWLGQGWFSKNDYAWTGFGSPRALLQLNVEYADGTTRTVVTSADWEATRSPVLENDVYDGETYDARLLDDGWTDPGFDADGWADAVAVEGPDGTLRPQRVQPVRTVTRFEPSSIEERDDGYVVDFGQNLTGRLRLDVEGAASGDVVEISHAEALTDEGELTTVDLRSADAVDAYVAGGEETETYEPRFTYHGFRYARITGYPGDLDPENVVAKVVHTDFDKRGNFACANDDLDAVQHAAEWSLRGNSVAVPTGCAQRDERTGWTGDAYLSARALLYNFDAGRFHAKWARDHDDEQSPHGYVPDTVPLVHGTEPGDPSWTTTRVAIPWYHYQFYGDERIIAEHYGGMRRHVEYWHSLSEEGYVPAEYGNYGDWLAFENTHEEVEAVGQPVDLFNTASHYRATRMLADAADELGFGADARRYREQAAVVHGAFNDRFFDADRSVYEPGTQAAYAVALSHGLSPDGREAAVVSNLVEKIREDGERLMTGFLGTRALLFALSEHGHVDLAYRLVSRSGQPGWVYMIRNGATTLWERWNSDEAVGSGMNSYNHHQFAYVSEWFYSELAGLSMGETTAAGTYEVSPRVPSDLDWAEGSIETPHGELSSRWERRSDGLRLDVSVPWNARASVTVPTPTNAAAVRTNAAVLWSTDDGLATELPDDVESVERVDGGVQVDVTGGTHVLDVTIDRGRSGQSGSE